MQGIGVSYVTTSEMSIHSLFYYTGPWNVVFSLKEEHQITKGNQLTTIPVLEKEWKVSFEFKANGYPATIQQVLHMTIGGKGTGSAAKYGDRTPAIWTHKTKGLLVASAVNGEVSHSEYFKPEVSENSRSREFSTRVSFIFSRSTTRNDFLKSRSRLET